MTRWQDNIDDWAHGFDVEAITWGGPVAQVPSPSWWASDSALIAGECPDFGPVLLKKLSRHAWSWRNRDNLIAAATAAGEAGIGPKIYAADSELGVLLEERLSPEWRVGRLDLFRDARLRQRLHEARAQFAQLDIPLSTRSPLIELLQLLDECDDRGIDVDPRVRELAAYVAGFRAPLLAYRRTVEMRPSQGEGTVSNIMVNPAGEVRLVGWGSAASLSAVHDHAVLVAEACPGALDIDDFISELAPEAEARDRAVIKLIAGIEHLRWAVLTRLRSGTDPDVNLDSIKYGLWRMTFAELLFSDPDTRTELEGALA
ncbi:hypothetical protein [Leucobacter chromiireducens]|uniref:Uncharacterized protein n=1 Tax=Leucobacter chromiireducens subsp. chromiireducens TaxID=660067 RepID=A0ABS1SNN2_9MICO|nr:hypothetical protein [Leucobacter chromiireducens]MBL3689773.1 hypothetical protein [Leucobacter chromiireducens subsp. chromiireducens]